MITKKLWNSLTDECRKKILEKSYESDIYLLPYHIAALVKPYNHNFNYDSSGKVLKDVLQDIKIDKNGDLSITLSVTPEYKK